jgi:hypothetical protein
VLPSHASSALLSAFSDAVKNRDIISRIFAPQSSGMPCDVILRIWAAQQSGIFPAII